MSKAEAVRMLIVFFTGLFPLPKVLLRGEDRDQAYLPAAPSEDFADCRAAPTISRDLLRHGRELLIPKALCF
jgi:hypothetical protein